MLRQRQDIGDSSVRFQVISTAVLQSQVWNSATVFFVSVVSAI